MVADVEPEHLALELEQHLLVPLALGYAHGEDVHRGIVGSTPSEPNRSNWPIASARLVSSTASTAGSYTLISPRRAWCSESKAPPLISASIVRLLQTTASTLRRKSAKSANSPFSARVATTDATTFAPTLRIAVSPNLMSLPTGVKFASEEFTHGGSTLMPMCRHSAR